MEKRYIVTINTINKVRDFVKVVTLFNSEFDLIGGRYTIDGKSIMGIFSLNLTNDLELVVRFDERDNLEVLEKSLEPFISKNTNVSC